VKVSQFIGQGRAAGVRASTFASLHLVLGFMGMAGLLFVVFRSSVPALFIDDPAVVSAAAGMMVIAGAFQLFDGLQVTMLGALRGLEDVRLPFGMLVLAHFMLALPVGWVLAFALEVGPSGIWLGYLMGLFSISVFLFLRFKWLVRNV